MIRFLILLFISFKSFSQIEVKLDNNLTGISSINTTKTIGVNYTGNNSFDFKKVSIDLITNYSTRFSPQIKENEFIQRQNIGYEKEKWDLFLTHQFNYSLIRKINSDNWIGLGGGLKFKYDWGKLTFSYAAIYQNSNYFTNQREFLFRHSLRTKIKFENKNINLYSEYFFQPNMFNFSDVIIYGTTKLNIMINKSLSFLIQDVLNYRSNSDVKIINNLSVGVGFKFEKKYQKN